MPKVIKDNGLTLVLMLMFLVSVVGQWLSGWRVENENLHHHGLPAIGLLEYLRDPAFGSALFENWESEFLQMSVYVVLTAVLLQKGSSESREPDAPPRDEFPSTDPKAPSIARRGDFIGWLYAHSLGLVLMVLFAASFVLHWTFSAHAAAQEALEEGRPVKPTLAYLGDAQLWFESFQNWQSEFLSTAVLVVLSIFLRHRNSPESKPLSASHGETGE